MQHFYLHTRVALLCPCACILGFRKRDRRAGPVFLYFSIGVLGIALERVLPGASLWLGDIGVGMMLSGSTLYAVSRWKTRRGRTTSDAA